MAVPEEKIDIKHIDEAPSETSISIGLKRRVARKIDYHVLPWLFGLWFFCFLDRTSIGNAKIDGLLTDLSLTGNQFNIALTVFFVSYILVDIPSNWLLIILKPGHYLPGLAVGWGLMTICFGFVRSFASLVVLRLLLGVFEGGITGGIVLYLSMFYPRHQIVFRIALFYSASPLSGAFGGLLAGALTRIEVGNYRAWPWIYFVEGAATLLFRLLTWIWLPHSPQTSPFFNEEERKVAQDRLVQASGGPESEPAESETGFHWHWVKIGILEGNTILASLAWLAIIVPLYSYAFFLPTIINALGYSTLVSQLLSVPPNFAGFLMVLAFAALSDRIKIKGPLIIGCCLLSLIGYIILIVCDKAQVKYGGTFFIAAGVYPCTPLFLGWTTSQIKPLQARAIAGGFQVSVGNMAAFIATFSYLPKDA
ncbi:uncharacterized protein APUU_10025S [Aspergillus puulaauensis]|uniref:Major facilitator superfamily (MFS) profile domain-containing protein n=1 Tax=Aspergillus puulaauensis TaxID=1220207 RepID=A0A7R7X989_9EURO|nr:uncharacterized protein APUU_10025S [Aspergillus puulaauensis]BCS17197.1 hypothetical protein APUU_10025S [Aspergillus puulaauensis]